MPTRMYYSLVAVVGVADDRGCRHLLGRAVVFINCKSVIVLNQEYGRLSSQIVAVTATEGFWNL